MTLYHGSCQCGAVQWRAEATLDRPVICNCSRCQRLGSVLVFAPAAGFVLEAGAAELTDYLFNQKVIRHRFCRICGVEGFAEAAGPDGTPMVALNVNCLDGVAPREVAARAMAYDGAAR